MTHRSLLVSAVLLVAACGSKVHQGPCDVSPPDPACDLTCDPTPGAPDTCPAGFHCMPDGTCNADCTPGGNECGDGATCTPDGTCVPSNGDGPIGPDADCPDVTLTTMPVTPTVELVLDQSGSMDDPYGGTTRWLAMRSALINPTTGVVANLADRVIFGVTLYSGVSMDQGGIQVGIPPCPRLTTRPRVINNFPAIQNLLQNSSPIEDTPTAQTLDAVRADFAANPPMAGSPAIVVLATDGLPDTCENADPRNQTEQNQANAITVTAAQAVFSAGIKLFYLQVGPDVTLAHAQQMANAGAGQDPMTGTAPYYVANNPTELTDAFNAIIGGVVGCELDLDGTIDPTMACDGTVTLNGNPLQCGTEWEAVDSNTIRLLGAACDAFKASGGTVSAVFPCGSIVE